MQVAVERAVAFHLMGTASDLQKGMELEGEANRTRNRAVSANT